MRVALLQLTAAAADAAENLDRGLTACSIASAGGADIALFPEMWQIGYTPCPDDADGRRAWANRAVETDGDWLGNFRRIAVELDMAVVITYLQRWRGAPRNAATLIDRTGQPVATYAKVHTCDFAMEAALTPGDAFRVADLATAHGKVRIGMMICFDREYQRRLRPTRSEVQTLTSRRRRAAPGDSPERPRRHHERTRSPRSPSRRASRGRAPGRRARVWSSPTPGAQAERP